MDNPKTDEMREMFEKGYGSASYPVPIMKEMLFELFSNGWQAALASTPSGQQVDVEKVATEYMSNPFFNRESTLERTRRREGFLAGLAALPATPIRSGDEKLELSDVEALIEAYDFAIKNGRGIEAILPNISIVRELLNTTRSGEVVSEDEAVEIMADVYSTAFEKVLGNRNIKRFYALRDAFRALSKHYEIKKRN